MELTVVKFSKGLRTCSAQTANEILVVFSMPPELAVSVGDKLVVPEFRMDAEVELLHERAGASFRVFIRSQDVHDLRLPAAHGTSRTPSPDRIDAA